MTKTEATAKINNLKKLGYKVINFNSQRRFNKSQKDFVDYVVIGKGFIYFIELKIGKDKLSPGQEETKKLLEDAVTSNLTVKYLLITENNIEEMLNVIYYQKKF